MGSCINRSLPNIIWVVDKWTKNVASVVTVGNARVCEVWTKNIKGCTSFPIKSQHCQR